MNTTHSLPHQTSTLTDSDAPIGLHPLFVGRECCPAQVMTDDDSTETIVVNRAHQPVLHHVVKGRFGSRPLNPAADIRLVEWIMEDPEAPLLESNCN